MGRGAGGPVVRGIGNRRRFFQFADRIAVMPQFLIGSSHHAQRRRLARFFTHGQKKRGGLRRLLPLLSHIAELHGGNRLAQCRLPAGLLVPSERTRYFRKAQRRLMAQRRLPATRRLRGRWLGVRQSDAGDEQDTAPARDEPDSFPRTVLKWHGHGLDPLKLKDTSSMNLVDLLSPARNRDGSPKSGRIVLPMKITQGSK